MNAINPLSLHSTIDQGNYLVTTQYRKSSQLLYTSSLYRYALYTQYKKRVCHTCLHYTTLHYTLHCTICHAIYFCSLQCQQNSTAHSQIQCQSYCKLQSCKYKNDDATLAVIKLVCDIYANEYQHQHTDQYTNHRNIIDITNMRYTDLVSHKQVKYNEIATYIANTVFNDDSITPILVHILGSIECNTFVLYADHPEYNVIDRRRFAYNCLHNTQHNTMIPYHPPIEIGKSMYLLPSMMNHSCIPSCSVIHYMNQLYVYAINELQPGDELTISYIDTDLPVTVRQQKLYELYNFHCRCKRCIDELSNSNKSNGSQSNVISMKSLLQQAKRITSKSIDLTELQQYINTSFQLTPLVHSIDSNDYILSGVNQIRYIPNVISELDEKSIIEQIQCTPTQRWTKLRNRSLQQWGGKVTINGLVNIESIPQYMNCCIERVQSMNIFIDNDIQPNHVLLNQYLPAQGISPHMDGPLYTPLVTILSLQSTVMLKFYGRLPNGSQLNHHLYSVLCEPRSLLVFSDDIYCNMWHAIDMSAHDIVDHRTINRHLLNKSYQVGDTVKRDNTRYSLTMRHVPVAKSI